MAAKNDFWDDEPSEDENRGPAYDKIWSIVSHNEVHISGVTYSEAEREWLRQQKSGNTDARFKKG